MTTIKDMNDGDKKTLSFSKFQDETQSINPRKVHPRRKKPKRKGPASARTLRVSTNRETKKIMTSKSNSC